MHIEINRSGVLLLTPDYNEAKEFREEIARDPNNIDGRRCDLLSGDLIDPMGDGVDYELAPPEEFRRGEGFVITDLSRAWHYPYEDLFEHLAKGDTTAWSRL